MGYSCYLHLTLNVIISHYWYATTITHKGAAIACIPPLLLKVVHSNEHVMEVYDSMVWKSKPAAFSHAFYNFSRMRCESVKHFCYS